MERSRQSVAFLDTHVALWLHDNRLEKLSARAKKAIEQSRLCYSPMMVLELAYLQEIGRISATPEAVLKVLTRDLEAREAETPFAQVVQEAKALSWTRDVFDRLLVAGAIAQSATLITADTRILEHCKMAVW